MGATFEDLERRLARVAVTGRDPMQLGFVPAARGEERAEDDRPAGLQGALIALRERFSGEENGGDAELFRREEAQVFGEEAGFLQLGGRSGNLFA